jgi:hypothetical protein
VKVYIFFSDQRLDATSVAVQIAESVSTPDFNPVNFRFPGRVYVQRLEFVPTSEPEPTVGTVVGDEAGARKSKNPSSNGGRPKPAM